MDKKLIEHDDFTLGSMILLAAYSLDEVSNMVKEDSDKPVFSDSFVNLACKRGR